MLYKITIMQYNSLQLLNDLYQQTTAFLDEAISKWQMMPDKKFSHQPAPTQWSAKQCLAHLNSYGDYYLPAIEKSIQMAREKNKTVSAVFSTGWLGGYFTKLMQTDSHGLPSKKIKAFKKYIHGNDEDGDHVIATFIEQQEKMLQLLTDAKNIDLNNTRTGISIAPLIQLKLGDVLMFIAAHTQRHLLQAARAAMINSEHTTPTLKINS